MSQEFLSDSKLLFETIKVSLARNWFRVQTGSWRFRSKKKNSKQNEKIAKLCSIKSGCLKISKIPSLLRKTILFCGKNVQKNGDFFNWWKCKTNHSQSFKLDIRFIRCFIDDKISVFFHLLIIFLHLLDVVVAVAVCGRNRGRRRILSGPQHVTEPLDLLQGRGLRDLGLDAADLLRGQAGRSGRASGAGGRQRRAGNESFCAFLDLLKLLFAAFRFEKSLGLGSLLKNKLNPLITTTKS